MNDRHNRYSFIPYIKYIVNNKTKLVMLASMLILSSLTGCNANTSYDAYSYNEYYEKVDYGEDTDVLDDVDVHSSGSGWYETEDFELLEFSKKIDLYNNKYFTELFGVENYTPDEVIEVSRTNKNILDGCRPYVEDFIRTMNDYYNELDNRVFCYNIADTVFEFTASDDVDFVLSGSVAFYDITNNRMVLDKNIDLGSSPKDRLVFRHELGHLFNHLKMTKDGYDIEYEFNDAGRGKYLKEALDVIFTTEPFLDEYSDDIQENMGYPITTNIVRVLLTAMDYPLEDSVSNNVYYFQNKMNEANSDDTDFSDIEPILEGQWIEYTNDRIQLDDEDYADLYRYVARAYIRHNMDSSISYDEISDSCTWLEEILIKGVSSDDYVFTDVIEDEFINFANCTSD